VTIIARAMGNMLNYVNCASGQPVDEGAFSPSQASAAAPTLEDMAVSSDNEEQDGADPSK